MEKADYMADKLREYTRLKRMIFLYFLNIQIPGCYGFAILKIYEYLSSCKKYEKTLSSADDLLTCYVDDSSIIRFYTHTRMSTGTDVLLDNAIKNVFCIIEQQYPLMSKELDTITRILLRKMGVYFNFYFVKLSTFESIQKLYEKSKN